MIASTKPAASAIPPSMLLERLPSGSTLPNAIRNPPTAPSAKPSSSQRIPMCLVIARRLMRGLWTLARTSRSRPELVPHPPGVHDPAGQAGGGELAAHTRGVRLERPRRYVAAVAPDVAQQLLAREHALRIGRELQQQRVLLRREDDVDTARHDAPCGAVDHELTEVEQLRPRWPPPKHRTDPRDELFIRERP